MITSHFQALDISGRKTEKTPEGYLVVTDVKLARTGIQNYLALEFGGVPGFELTDTIRVYRPPEEVFKEDSMKTFAMKPVTNDHPGQMLDKDNTQFSAVGSVGSNVKRDGDHLIADKIVFTDAKAIADIEAGKVQLSNGYLVDYEFEPGVTPNGEKYDAVQKNIVGNHVALVSNGRCGPTCSIFDGKSPCNCQSGGKETMKTIKLNGVDCEVDDTTAQLITNALDSAKAAGQQAVDAANAKVTKLEADLETATTNVSKVEGERDAALAEVDKLKKAKPEGDALQLAVNDHIKLMDQVRKFQPEFDFDGKTADQIILKVVSDANPNVDFEGRDASYIRARFDQMVSLTEDGGADAVLQVIKGGKVEDGDKVVDAAQSRLDSIAAKKKRNVGGAS